jgi:hypothetical protein
MEEHDRPGLPCGNAEPEPRRWIAACGLSGSSERPHSDKIPDGGGILEIRFGFFGITLQLI